MPAEQRAGPNVPACEPYFEDRTPKARGEFRVVPFLCVLRAASIVGDVRHQEHGIRFAGVIRIVNGPRGAQTWRD